MENQPSFAERSVPLDRLSVSIGDLDRQFAGNREAGCFDGGEWARPLRLLAGTLRWADPPARLTTLDGESGERVVELFWGFRRRSSWCGCGRREVKRWLFGTHKELLHSTGARKRAPERGEECSFSLAGAVQYRQEFLL